ncbi:50S ribosomal protein L25 [Abyssisolibacter fermentans]|uniref:50S ribosomal protein L25 n=1 Tax=Abyssisolibacter fermentans TaxID=1766203 RepID=UPI0008328ED5|nr:50S ribosomal protein L25 [Abyssisolibacter fermentans]
MNVATLTATVRNEKGKKSRRQGFVPAVIYGHAIQSESIKLNYQDVVRVLNQYGGRTRIILNINGEKKIGIIKDVDIESTTSKIQHLDIQLVNNTEKVNWEIPIIFTGREELERRRLILQVNLPQIKVMGELNIIPDALNIDVSNKEANETITIADLKLDDKIRVSKASDTVLAIIKAADIVVDTPDDEDDTI